MLDAMRLFLIRTRESLAPCSVLYKFGVLILFSVAVLMLVYFLILVVLLNLLHGGHPSPMNALDILPLFLGAYFLANGFLAGQVLGGGWVVPALLLNPVSLLVLLLFLG